MSTIRKKNWGWKLKHSFGCWNLSSIKVLKMAWKMKNKNINYVIKLTATSEIHSWWVLLRSTRERNSLDTQIQNCVKSDQLRSFSGPNNPVFSPNTGKYGPEKTPDLETFHAVQFMSCVQGLWDDTAQALPKF